MRILNIIRSLDPRSGGPAEGLRQSCRATRRMGSLQEVVTLDAPQAPWLEGFPAAVQAFGPSLAGYGYTRELTPWLSASAHNFDAVIVHGLWQHQGLATWRALRGGPVPYYVYPHGMLDPWFKRTYPIKHLKKQLYWRSVESRVLRDARGVFFTTSEEARLAAQTFSPYDVRGMTVGCGLALDPMAQRATAEDFLTLHPQLRGRRLLLFMARIHLKKGLDLLIEALSRIAASHPTLHLVVAGPDESGLRPALNRQAVRLAVQDRITWTGMLRGQAKWGALRAADAFALPSRQENFGIAVAEALAVGTPVLISDRVNIWREVAEGGAGIVGPDHVQGTAEVLSRWLALDDDERARMRACAVQVYERHFHADTAAKTLLATLQAHGTADSRS
ncbi:MAG: glycosyltransferase [Chitinophagaceae bacterium]|nr:glycosyltransferase [Rubrivivax sp.]